MRRKRTVGVLAPLVVLAVLVATLVAHHADTGLVLRAVTLPQGTRAVAVDARRGRVFVTSSSATGGSSMSVLDARTGAVMAAYPISSGGFTLALDTRTQLAFIAGWWVAGSPGDVDVRDMQSRRLLRTVRVGVGPSSVAVDEQTGRAFVVDAGASGDPGGIDVLDAHSGRLLRAIAVGSYPASVAVDARRGRVVVASLGMGGVGRVSVLDARSGAVLRTTPAGHNPGLAALAVDTESGRAFVAFANNYYAHPSLPGSNVITLDIRTGAVLGTTPVGRAPQAVAVDARTGRVFVVNMGDGTVSVPDAHSGAFLRAVTVGPNPSAMAVDERTGRVFVALAGPTSSDGVFVSAGRVHVLDARSGSILHTVIVGPDPRAVAVDEATRRAFVISGGGIVRTPDAWGWVPLWLRRRLPFLPPPGPRTHWVPGSVTVLDAAR